MTSENSLQGERIAGVDNYVGTYSAEYNDFSNTEYLLVVLILKGKTEVIYPLPVLYKLIAERLKYSGFPEVKNQLS